MKKNRLSELINQIENKGRIFKFEEYNKTSIKEGIPEQGIYIFTDPNEPKYEGTNLNRIVRVGTHGTTEKTKNRIIKKRLDDHYNKGSSSLGKEIIPIHIKNTYKKEYTNLLESNITGRTNIKRAIGEELYSKVLEFTDSYIKGLNMIVLEVKTWEERKQLEFDIIKTLIDNRNYIKASKNWLGLNSDKKEIRESLLWNVKEARQVLANTHRNQFYYSDKEFKDVISKTLLKSS